MFLIVVQNFVDYGEWDYPDVYGPYRSAEKANQVLQEMREKNPYLGAFVVQSMKFKKEAFDG